VAAEKRQAIKKYTLRSAAAYSPKSQKEPSILKKTTKMIE
jgi:hypothetical protein